MDLDLFDFDLPDDRIALRPARPRDSARLLEVGPGGTLADRVVSDLPALLRPGDALVLNDTRVVPAELAGTRTREDAPAVEVSVTLFHRETRDAFRAFARPARRLRPGDRIHFVSPLDASASLEATVTERTEGEVVLTFAAEGSMLDAAIAEVGVPPLPPYISARRPADAADVDDYQTVFAREEGAVAAPTAGLHFTDDLLARLQARGVERHQVTLHVGPGTFLPVKTERLEDHVMHAEFGRVSADTAAALNAVRARGGRIVAVGTTSLRLLESAVDEAGRILPFSGETSIFIKPGHRFRAVDLLLTNFHLPRSTLFVLVAAFSGRETMLAAYRHAIAAGYRFYSYGDACLLHPAGTA
ncbi:MAG: tRNA preQ1(34) S-adenosylmethionine ribosyltransferase-isomerase QueA [Bauldia sp.]|nr:tRNA preQ1(34) S-adenosylmethionine ribosyltransferase-isomerase QueA [Bauldia sp.]